MEYSREVIQMKKNIKIIFSIFLISFMTANLFCQTENTSEENSKSKIDFSKITILPYANMGIQLQVNAAPKEDRAPSPVLFNIGGGAIINMTDFITLEPHLDFWTQYYLYDGKDARPAEVEHRTATMLCFMLDIPVGFNFKYGNHTLTPGAGLGLLMRFGFLSNGVKSSDSGATGSAQGDVEKINSWMWDKARFIYPELFFAWTYKISEDFSAGAVLRCYIPIGSIIDGKGLDATIINLSARFIF